VPSGLVITPGMMVVMEPPPVVFVEFTVLPLVVFFVVFVLVLVAVLLVPDVPPPVVDVLLEVEVLPFVEVYAVPFISKVVCPSVGVSLPPINVWLSTFHIKSVAV
jgi:hypothetical protein